MTQRLTVFGVLVREQDWGYSRFLREFRRSARELRLDGLEPSRKQFDRWRRGELKGKPREDSCLVLENMFAGKTIKELLSTSSVSSESIATTGPETKQNGQEPDCSSAPADMDAVLLEEDDMKRRTMLLGLTTGAVLSDSQSAAQLMTLARQRVDAALEASTVSTATLERWEATAYSYARSYQTVPSQQLLGDALADLLEVQRLLEKRHPIKHRRRLCRVVAQLAALCGVFSSALGDHRGAQGWFHTGRLAANESGDAQLAGNIAVRSAIVSLYYGSPATAYEQSVEAQEITGSAIGPALARALVVQGRALARLHRGDEALPVLRKAEDTFSRLTPDDRSNLAFGYTERQFWFTMGNAWTHLGRCEDASEFQQRALDAYPPGEHLDPSLVRLDQATRLVYEGGRKKGTDLPSKPWKTYLANTVPEWSSGTHKDFLSLSSADTQGFAPTETSGKSCAYD